MASLAPTAAEQAGLYVEMFTFAASSIILFLVGIVFNWKVAKDVGACASVMCLSGCPLWGHPCVRGALLTAGWQERR